MRRNGVRGALAALALMAAADGAYAATVPVNCPMSGAGALVAQFGSGGTENTVYLITGPCDGNFFITQNNITIQGSGGPQTINGPIGIQASNIALEDLTINGGNLSGVVAVFPTSSVSVNGGTITLQNGLFDGVVVFGPAKVFIANTTVQNNSGIGLHASEGAVIDAILDTVTGNGGGGVRAERNSSVSLDEVTVTGPSSNHTVLVSQGSSAIVHGSTITADTPFSADNQLAVITAARSSSVVLVGGNTINNNAAGGAAVIVSAGSTFEESNGTLYGFTQANDTIQGRGLIHTQSVIELGASPGTAAITWIGNVLVNQASSFRADGANVTINGTLTLDQSANGYFNHFAGTSNSISLVKCNSTTDHVSNPTLVTPNVTIGPPPGCALF